MLPGSETGGSARDEPLIFVSDASAEAERLTAALRSRGYDLVDVPLSMLNGRVAVQRPSLILCDVDADGALETVHRLRDIPGGAGVDIIFLGEPGRTLDDMADAVFHEGSGFFVRPVDVYALLRKVEALIGPPLAKSAPPSIFPTPRSGVPVKITSTDSADVRRPAPSQPPPPLPDAIARSPSQPPPRSMPLSRTPSQPPPRAAADRTPSQPPPRSAPGSRGPSSAPPDSRRQSTEPPQRASSNPPIATAHVPTSTERALSPERASFERTPNLPPAVPLGFGTERGARSAAQRVPQSDMSPELEALLLRAEQRVSKDAVSSIPPPQRLSPEAEVEAVLPADVLAALDEPLDLEDEDDEGSGTGGTRSGSETGRTGAGTHSAVGTVSGATGAGAGSTTSGVASLGSAHTTGVPISQAVPQSALGVTTVGGRPESSGPVQIAEVPQINMPQMLQPTTPPPRGLAAGFIAPAQPPAFLAPLGASEIAEIVGAPVAPLGAPPASLIESEPPPTPPAVPTRPPSPGSWVPPSADGSAQAAGRPATLPPPTTAFVAAEMVRDAPATEPPADFHAAERASASLEIPAAIGRGDALRAVALAIRARFSGALAFEDDTGIRRAVLRDGDFVTAASGIESESLVGFLTQRGDLSPDAARLARKLPQFGRHAGAALIAHGHLRQDDLWPVLRAHAEWLLARMVTMTRGAASIEKQIPPRLQTEPAVFGGATGAEVLVEIARRTVPSEEAIARLGGPGAQLGQGPAPALIGECALPDAERMLVEEAKTARVDEILARATTGDFAAVLHALAELGVLASVPSREPARIAEAPDELDDTAMRARILARKALVDEGDYFALLGISRAATAYDIRRAYGDLRRQFEPARALTAKNADLRDTVDLILDVLDEAYDVLRDERRRDRYRRALEATPVREGSGARG